MMRRFCLEARIEQDALERFLLACHRDGLTPGEAMAALVDGRRLDRMPATFGQWLDRGGMLDRADQLATRAEDARGRIDALLDRGAAGDDPEITRHQAEARDALEGLEDMFKEYERQTGAAMTFQAAADELAGYLLEADAVRQSVREMEGGER